MKALLVNVNFYNGERAGGIDPRGNHNLPVCWQAVSEGIEIRFVRDGNVEPYRNVEGIRVLETMEAFDAALTEHVTTGVSYRVSIDALLMGWISANRVEIRNVGPGFDPQEQLKQLYELGAIGIERVVPEAQTAAGLCERWGIPLE